MKRLATALLLASAFGCGNLGPQNVKVYDAGLVTDTCSVTGHGRYRFDRGGYRDFVSVRCESNEFLSYDYPLGNVDYPQSGLTIGTEVTAYFKTGRYVRENDGNQESAVEFKEVRALIPRR